MLEEAPMPFGQHDYGEQKALVAHAVAPFFLDVARRRDGIDQAGKAALEISSDVWNFIEPPVEPFAHRQHEPLLGSLDYGLRHPSRRDSTQRDLRLLRRESLTRHQPA